MEERQILFGGDFVIFKIPYQANADPPKIMIEIALGNMCPPNMAALPPISGDFTHGQSISIADDVMIWNRMDRVIALSLSVNPL